MIHFMLLFSRQGKLRLQKWFDAYQVFSIFRDLKDYVTFLSVLGKVKKENNSRTDLNNTDKKT